MIDAMGRGWCFTFIALVVLVTSPMLWTVYFKGAKWREARRVRIERHREEKENRIEGEKEEKEKNEKSRYE